mmetsp:Transcript_27853/g.68868  ORF Transcript_27853/g.68868 Transcript_27853/m.68868 type:complete len:242 (+) Transcript_27853:259-984(+)
MRWCRALCSKAFSAISREFACCSMVCSSSAVCTSLCLSCSRLRRLSSALSCMSCNSCSFSAISFLSCDLARDSIAVDRRDSSSGLPWYSVKEIPSSLKLIPSASFCSSPYSSRELRGFEASVRLQYSKRLTMRAQSALTAVRRSVRGSSVCATKVLRHLGWNRSTSRIETAVSSAVVALILIGKLWGIRESLLTVLVEDPSWPASSWASCQWKERIFSPVEGTTTAGPLTSLDSPSLDPSL